MTKAQILLLIPLALSFFVSCDTENKNGDSSSVQAPNESSLNTTSKETSPPEITAAPNESDSPLVVIETSMGSIQLKLNKKAAPATVANFLKYVDSKHYDDTVFHRVISNFMIQGGGFAVNGDKIEEKETNEPIKNEAKNGLHNVRGSIAMARTNDPHSATAQFFINVADNSLSLDPSARGFGYAVFGEVVSGMDVVDKIRAVKTGPKTLGSRGPSGQLFPSPSGDVPIDNVVIQSIRRSEEDNQ